MIIRNRKSGKEYNVNSQEWEKIKEMKFHLLFVIVDKTDMVFIPEQNRMVIPDKLIEYQTSIKELRIEKTISDIAPKFDVTHDTAPKKKRKTKS
jgi:hypothetical protein